MTKVEPIALILIIIAVATAGFTVIDRGQNLDPGRTVELVLDYDETVKFARRYHVPLDTLLSALKGAGISTLMVGEVSLKELLEGGQVAVLRGYEYLDWLRLKGGALGQPGSKGFVQGAGDLYVVVHDQNLGLRLEKALQKRLGERRVRSWTLGEARVLGVSVWTGVVQEREGLLQGMTLPEAVLETGLGLSREGVLAAERFGFRLVPQLANFPALTPGDLERTLEEITNQPVQVSALLFSGRQAWGYPGQLATVARALASRGFPLGLVEHKDQEGLYELVRRVNYRAVRVHVPYQGERIESMVLSATDRKIRMVLLRPEAVAQDPSRTVALNVNRVERIVDAFRTAGFEVGPGRPFRAYRVGYPALVLMMAGVLAACYLLAVALMGRRLMFRPSGVFLFVLGFAGAALLLAGPWAHVARQGLAFLSAVTFPALGVWTFATNRGINLARSKLGPNLGSARGIRARQTGWLLALVRAAWSVVLITAVSVAGGLIVVGLLGDVDYALQLAQFRGVKPALVGPTVVLLALGLRHYVSDGVEGFGSPGMKLAWTVQRVFRTRIRLKHVVFGAVAAAAGVVLLLRTGNFPGIPVSALEIKLRLFLEEVMGVRPRTKEFLVGHPLLMLAVAAGRAGFTWYMLPVAAVAAVGQASVVNSFSHLHTPVGVSLVRTLNGLGLGIFGGVVLTLVAGLVLSLRDRTAKETRVWSGTSRAEVDGGGDDV